jgi:hypothetical protein
MEKSYEISNFYYVVALENRERFKSMSQSLENLKSDDKEKWMKSMEHDSIVHNSLKSAVSCVVFSAMCLEAFIFAYSERFLGKNYTKKHLDKLSLDSKYIIIPRLIVGKEINRDGQAYEKLKKLLKHRNEIVHYKSKAALGGSNPISFLGSASFLPKAMKNGIEATHEIMNELKDIHPEEEVYFQGVVTYAECFA